MANVGDTVIPNMEAQKRGLFTLHTSRRGIVTRVGRKLVYVKWERRRSEQAISPSFLEVVATP